MLFSCFLLLCLTQSLLAVELFIYKSFTEVREFHNGIGEYSYQFTTAEYGNVIDGSISWDGTPFVRQEISNRIQSLQDAEVTVRRSTACECEVIPAKIVDPVSMLLKNLKTGAYFYADKQSLEYASIRPNDGGISLTLQFDSETTTQHSGTLSYLMTGITWTPNYDLFLIGNTGDSMLRAYANINNDQQREYTVENTHLLGGDVQLATSQSGSFDKLENMVTPSSLRPIQLDGEQRGLYSYSLDNKYTLRPSSSIRLPFIDVAAKYRFYYKSLVNVVSGQYEGVFERNYDLTPNCFMPAGIITIRDNHVLVGQAQLPDVPANYTQTMSVGQDEDVRYSIKSNLTSKSDEKSPVSMETYQLDVQMMNFKDKTVDGQLVFRAGLRINILDTTCKLVQVNGNELRLSFQLERNERRQCLAKLTVRLS